LAKAIARPGWTGGSRRGEAVAGTDGRHVSLRATEALVLATSQKVAPKRLIRQKSNPGRRLDRGHVEE
jgi:hypothetical protein